MRFPNQKYRQLSLRNELGIAKGPVILLIAVLLIIGAAAYQFMQSRPIDHAQENRSSGQLNKLKNPASPAPEIALKKNTDPSSAKNDRHDYEAAVSGKSKNAVLDEALATDEQKVQSNTATGARNEQTAATSPVTHMNLAQSVPAKQPEKNSAATKPQTVTAKPNSNQTTSSKPAVSASQAENKETFADMIARARKSLFTIYNVQDMEDEYNILQGSTFLYNNKGMLVTNGHVVEGSKTVGVIAGDGKKYTGTVIGFSYTPDVALIHVPDLSGKNPFPMDSKKYDVNSPVAAIANHLSVKTTKGKIIEKDLNMKTDPDDPYYYPNMYVVTAATPPGFSGGPLISTKTNKIIGINSLHSLAEANIGYSMPIKEAEKLLKKWSEKPMTEKQITGLYKDPNFNDKTTAKRTTIKKEKPKQDTEKKSTPDKKASAAKAKSALAQKDEKEDQALPESEEKAVVQETNEEQHQPAADSEEIVQDKEQDDSIPSADEDQVPVKEESEDVQTAESDEASQGDNVAKPDTAEEQEVQKETAPAVEEKIEPQQTNKTDEEKQTLNEDE